MMNVVSAGKPISNCSKSEVLEALFQYFKQQSIQFCVLGKTNNLPQEVTSDVDIMVLPHEIQHMPRLLSKFATENQLFLVQCIQHEITAFYFVLAWFHSDGSLHFLHPDICSDYYFDGQPRLRAIEVLRRAQPAQNCPHLFSVPRSADNFIYYWIKKVEKLSLSQLQAAYLYDLWQQDVEAAQQRLQYFWPQSPQYQGLVNAFEKQDFEALKAQLPALKQQLRQQHVASFADWFWEQQRRLRRVLFPTGYWVCFLGADGSGKTTMIDKTLVHMAPAFRRTKFFHLLPIQRPLASSQHSTLPQSQPPYTPLVSCIKLLYLGLNAWIGFYLCLLPAMVCSTLVLFDRYLDDVQVDARRFRYNAPMIFAKALAKWIPRPSRLIILSGDPEVIHARKQEVPLAETSRQCEVYQKLAKARKEAILIMTDSSPEDACERICRALIEDLAHRVKRHVE